MPVDPKPPTGGDLRWLRCEECHRVAIFTAAEVLKFTRRGWPRCCKKKMLVFPEVPQGDTPRHNVPRLPTDGPG